MPFNIATFRQYVETANPSVSRFKQSSLAALDTLLAGLGGAVGPGSFAQIQPVYAAIPHAKQQKYAGAVAYLKQFVPGLSDAIPASPTMEYKEFKVMLGSLGGNPQYPMRFYHVHKLSWKPSNGNVASLANVGTRERVTHRSNPAGPPFDQTMNANIPMVFTQGATTNNGAQVCENYDDHSTGNPALIVRRPLAAGSVIADQDYEYTTDGVNWYSVPKAQYEIEKGVRQSRGQLVFYFRKQSSPPHANEFHFEVEYPIGPAVAVPGNRIPVIPAGFAAAKNIRDYASLIVSLR